MENFYRFLIIAMFCLLSIDTVQANPARPVNSNDQQLAELNNRLNSFESNWNRFQIGGELNLKSSSLFQPTKKNFGQLNFSQQLDLYLNTMMDNRLTTAVKLTHYGGWGQYSNYPMNSPLQLDEAYLRWNHPTFIGYLGRYHFSLSQLGLISDFTSIPIEGATFQKVYKNFQAVGLYSRVYTIIGASTGTVESAEDYWSARLGWSNRNHVLGINIVPDGISGETSFSIDWSTDWFNQKLAVEAAWRSFDSFDPQLKVERDPGILVSYGKVIDNNDYLQIKLGYFAPGFSPQYSSLAHISGDNREWFIPNSQGIELFWQKQFLPGWNWENRMLLFQPVAEYGSSHLNYRLASTIVRVISPINHLKFGFDLKEDYAGVSNSQFNVTWNLRF